jgi:hypothetical protein
MLSFSVWSLSATRTFFFPAVARSLRRVLAATSSSLSFCPTSQNTRQIISREGFFHLREANWNESKAALVLRMHRNTLRRTVRELDLDVRALRKSERRHVRRVDQQTILAS